MKKLFVNGNFITMTDEKIDWLLVDDKKIVELGNSTDSLPSSDVVIDLEGQTLMPGFINSHIHSLPTGMSCDSVFIFECENMDQVYDAMTEQLQGRPNSFVMVEGFNSGLITFEPEKHLAKLDSISGDRPIFIKYTTGHGGILNSKAMNLIGATKSTPLTENEMSLAQNLFTDAEIKSFMKKFSDECVSHGITLAHSLIYDDIDNRDIPWWIDEENGNGFLDVQVRNFMQTMDVEYVHSLGLPRIGGCVCLDGTPVELTACFEEDYATKPGYNGDLYLTDQELYDMISKAHSYNMQCAFHAVGDRAVHQLIGIYDKVISEQGSKGLRHRIEHVDLISPEMLKRASELGLVISIQPAILYNFGKHLDDVLGAARNKTLANIKKYHEAGVLLTGGTDTPVTTINPLYAIHCIVNDENPMRRLPLDIALEIFTLNGAISVHEDNNKGSLSIGKDADMVILEKDPYAHLDSIKDIKVTKTYILGDEIYNRRK